MKILFVCNGNVARSQEAEAFFNSMWPGEEDYASSCGVNVRVGKPIDPFVVQVMDEVGLGVSRAERKFIKVEMVENADIVVSFKPKNELPEYLMKTDRVRFWDVADPRHQPVEFHRQVRDEIRHRVTALVAELR